MVKRLQQLRNFEIILVCDDSGSMMTTVDGTQRTRWDELCAIVKIIVDIGVLFDRNGVDIYFLNREPLFKVKSCQQIDQVFQIPPSGYTPLAPVLTDIFESQLARPGRDKKLLVFVATDGEPTDQNDNINIAELEQVMREKRQADTTYVSFLVCTDVSANVDYLREWDQAMANVDVTDDFNTQREKVRQCCGDDHYFSYGDYVIKAILGAIDQEIDDLDTPR